MRVRIGYEDRDNSATNLYAAAQFLYAAQPQGTDYRWTIEDIPLFWKKYIADVDVNLDQHIYSLQQARDAAYLASTRIPMTCYSTTFDHTGAAPDSWFNNHLRTRG
jgi:hypothetical protein